MIEISILLFTSMPVQNFSINFRDSVGYYIIKVVQKLPTGLTWLGL